MKRWLGVVLGMVAFGGVFVAGFGQDHHPGLREDTGLPVIPPGELNAGSNTPCMIDCVRGEILAVFNPAVGAAPGTNIDVLMSKIVADPKGYFQKLINRANQGNKVAFTGLTAYGLPVAGNALSPLAQVCGKVLLRFKFKLDSGVDEGVQVIDAVRQLQAAIPAGEGTLEFPGQARLYGVQPNGTGMPAQTQSKETEPQNSRDRYWATEITGRQKLDNSKRSVVNVAVLDSGFTLGARPDPGYVRPPSGVNLNLVDLDVPNNNVKDTYNELGAAGHGTGIASIIADPDKRTGMARNAAIIPIKICGEDGMCQEASNIFATCLAASSQVGASVINMSFGSLPDSPIMQAAIQDVARAGSLVVAAAGNTNDSVFIDKHNGQSNNKVRPAFYSSGPDVKRRDLSPEQSSGVMLSVGAIWTDLRHAPFATHNEHVDLVGPGSWVRVQGNYVFLHDSKNDNKHNYDGTSYAAAYVSGAAALLIGKQPGVLTARQAALELIKTADPNLCYPKSMCGAGLVQAK
jgi:subtilisin family serine protease